MPLSLGELKESLLKPSIATKAVWTAWKKSTLTHSERWNMGGLETTGSKKALPPVLQSFPPSCSSSQTTLVLLQKRLQARTAHLSPSWITDPQKPSITWTVTTIWSIKLNHMWLKMIVKFQRIVSRLQPALLHW